MKKSSSHHNVSSEGDVVIAIKLCKSLKSYCERKFKVDRKGKIHPFTTTIDRPSDLFSLSPAIHAENAVRMTINVCWTFPHFIFVAHTLWHTCFHLIPIQLLFFPLSFHVHASKLTINQSRWILYTFHRAIFVKFYVQHTAELNRVKKR